MYKNKLTPSDEISDRIDRFRNVMESHGIGGALIMNRVNYYYFSGTSQNAVLYLPLDDDPILFVRRDIDRANDESPLSRILPYRSSRELPRLINDCCKKIPKKIAVELDVLPAQNFLKLQSIFEKVEFENATPVIMSCRIKKSAFEVDQIRKASQIAKEVFETGRRILMPGMSEIEFGAILEMEAKKRGHEGLIRMHGLNSEGYSWHILSGPSGTIVSEADTPSGGQGLSPAFPMGAGERQIQVQDPILVDFPVCYNGYISDQTRMFCVGDLPEKFVRAYEFCREVVARILEEAWPGMKCEEALRIGEKMAQEQGYEEGFLGLVGKKAKFIGHGVGLEANERPVLGAKQNYPLEADVVVAIEPKVVFPGQGVVGIENMYYFSENGYEILTQMDESIFQV